MAAFLLDTNTVQCLLKKDKPEYIRVKTRLQNALKQNAVVIMSPLVFYELARLLYLKGAAKQLGFLQKLAAIFDWRDLDRTSWDMGAKFWAQCRTQGKPTGEGLDIDALIAAQADLSNATVITANTRHFDYLGTSNEAW